MRPTNKQRETVRKFVDSLRGGEAVVLSNTHVGLQLERIRHGSSRFIVTCALEGVNPFVQDEHEIRYQCAKAGLA